MSSKNKTNKLSKIRSADPFLERELTRYENPLPSREYAIQVLEREGRPLEFEELATLLDIDHSERDSFQRRLGAMEREGQVMKNRRGAFIIPERAALLAGKIEGHPDGYGFFKPDDGSPDIFLDQQQMQKALHGDRALVRIKGLDRKGKPEGSIVEVTDHANARLVGRVMMEHGLAYVVPENRRITQSVLIPPEKKAKIKPTSGQVVMVDIIEQPSRYSQPIGRIAEVIGNYADPGMEIEIALRKHDLPFEFSPAALAENEAVPDKVKKADHAGREDLRNLPLVTIDGETARDFDDAVYCEPLGKGKGWRLVVAIADVSHYVKPGMALDKEAMERGNSVYFPRRVIPMLPEKLSNGICSLNPEVERLAMVAEMRIDPTGKIAEYRFYKAVFRSHARLTYNQVWTWLSGETTPEQEASHAIQPSMVERVKKILSRAPKHKTGEAPPALMPHLENLYDLFKTLVKARAERGAIDFETVETQMIFNAEGKIDNIVPVVRNDAHRIIEECMLAANVCASDFLAKNKHPCLYRVHAGPSEEKLTQLRAFLGEVGLQLGGGDDPQAKDFSKLLERIKLRPDMQLLQTVMLRSLKQAMYTPDNVGHFGLAYEHYTHFTSPIRRYPDLLVHRAIKAVLDGEQYKPGNWEEIGLRCSATERRADEATRDVDNWLKCYYMKERIGEEFEGTIASVVPFGIFVGLDTVYVEGLIHVSDLGADYFQYDKARHQMIGERTGKRYRLGDRVRVKLVRADLESNRIDFVLAPLTKEGTRGGGKSESVSAPAAGDRGGRGQDRGAARGQGKAQDSGSGRKGSKSGGGAKTGEKAATKAAAKPAGKGAAKPGGGAPAKAAPKAKPKAAKPAAGKRSK